ncbi:hypothetical protein MVES_003340 [Malassezia vespertilionis]|uniref:Glycoside hydrolase family 5 domain-containing protein n=1 Tax=Malassezia vespertilionis TaxID=2020962 RepID=A0A2N1J7K2_9BASI|nr:hypothetical protein MVES_003340 [Malassezia vespertilionis]
MTPTLAASDIFFRDEHGRSVLLRGINFTGNNKMPCGIQTQDRNAHLEPSDTFVNPCVSLDDGAADTHLRRIRSWGMNCLRYIFTWEAIEHEGPGIYDESFLAYTVAVLRRAKAHGFLVIMDPHQDVPRNFSCTHAAIIHAEYPDAENPNPASSPPMIWASNYDRIASLTLFTLFFGGRMYAPKCILDGENIQDWLQRHYFAAVQQLIMAVRDAGDLFDTCVIGWDSLNEPHSGIIGCATLEAYPGMLRLGSAPTIHEGLILGSGQPVRAPTYIFTRIGPIKTGSKRIDPQGRSMWLTPEQDAVRGAGRFGWRRDPSWTHGCVWELHGVWDSRTKALLKPSYFAAGNFLKDHWLPHWEAYEAIVRALHPGAIQIVQPPVFHAPPRGMDTVCGTHACCSAHFYDGLTLMTKHWNWYGVDGFGLMRDNYRHRLFAFFFGPRGIRKALKRQLAYLHKDTLDYMGNYPLWLGETGIPFDMDHKDAYYKHIGDYTSQARAMNATLDAADSTLLSYAIWNYAPLHSFAWGDGWDGEDFSVWSPDEAARQPAMAPALDKLVRGTRAIESWCRPYAVSVPGELLELTFDMRSSFLKVSLRTPKHGLDTPEALRAVLFLPYVHYGAPLPTATWGTWIRRWAPWSRRGYKSVLPRGAIDVNALEALSPEEEAALRLSLRVNVSDGQWSVEGQYLTWAVDPAHTHHTIALSRAPGPADYAQFM